jgi:succinoglycan biosynthesis transport protein ExoP
MTDSTARPVRSDGAATRKLDGLRRAVSDKSWDALSPEDVAFSEEWTARPGRMPILEALKDPSSVVGEELRLLRSRVTDLCRQRKISCLAMTSALPGEGKSTLSVGLAAALARQPGKRILLIEGDLRRPSLATMLGLSPATGLSEWLHGQIDHVPVRFVDPGGFRLLVAGQTPLERPEILGSPRMDALLRAARGLFDYVVLDAMPLVPVADSTLLKDLVDGFLLVVRYRLTPKNAIREGLAKLDPDNVLGLVMNDYREILPSYTAYAYSRYGMTYGPSNRETGRSSGRKSGSER